jgi:hypothetical protein
MASDEEVTRRLLREAAPGHRGLSVESVARAVDRRSHRRARIALVSAPLLTAATVGAALLGAKWIGLGEVDVPVVTPTSTASTAGPVPWIDTPAAGYPAAGHVEPSPSTTEPRSAPACSGGDITAEWGTVEGATGHLYHPLWLANSGAGDCSVTGHPDVLASEPGLPDVTADPTSVGESSLVTLAPGDRARLVLESRSSCEAHPGGGGQSVVYHHVEISLADGTSVVAQSDAGLDLKCGLGASSFQFDENHLGTPVADPWRDLSVRVDAEGSAIVDGSLTYVVSLTNYGADDVSLTDRCPSYVETLTSEPSGNLTAKASYLLNCTDTSTIPAGATVAFGMKLPLPDGIGGTPMTLTWALAGPDLPSGSANVVVADVPDELLPRTIDELRVGASTPFLYRAHCGVEWLYVGAEVWRTQLRDDGSHNPPPGWPEMIPGTLTRTAKDRITFTSDDIPEVLVFEPAPAAADPGECN